MSHGLTILDALHRFDFFLTSAREELVIHVTGVERGFDSFNSLGDVKIMFEEVAHQLPYIKRMVVNFVGPRVELGVDGHDVPLATCATCTASGKRLAFAGLR